MVSKYHVRPGPASDDANKTVITLVAARPSLRIVMDDRTADVMPDYGPSPLRGALLSWLLSQKVHQHPRCRCCLFPVLDIDPEPDHVIEAKP